MPGGQIQGKDAFKPITRWANKSTVPTQTLIINCHTNQTFSLLENHSQQLKFSERTKRVKHDSNLVDLTVDEGVPAVSDEDNRANKGEIEERSTSLPIEHTEEFINEDVSIVRVPKQITLVDITDETNAPVCTTLTL